MNNHCNDELLDLVSDNDTVIRSEFRSVIYQQNLKWIRGVSAFIINTRGQFWIPRRHPNKKLLPLHLDMSVGGHVQTGESYEQALMRETLEEAGLDLTHLPWEKILYLTPQKHGTFAFGCVYAIYHNETPILNNHDFISSQWLYPSEILTMIEQGEKVKSDLSIILRNLPKKISTKKH